MHRNDRRDYTYGDQEGDFRGVNRAAGLLPSPYGMRNAYDEDVDEMDDMASAYEGGSRRHLGSGQVAAGGGIGRGTEVSSQLNLVAALLTQSLQGPQQQQLLHGNYAQTQNVLQMAQSLLSRQQQQAALHQQQQYGEAWAPPVAIAEPSRPVYRGSARGRSIYRGSRGSYSTARGAGADVPSLLDLPQRDASWSGGDFRPTYKRARLDDDRERDRRDQQRVRPSTTSGLSRDDSLHSRPQHRVYDGSATAHTGPIARSNDSESPRRRKKPVVESERRGGHVAKPTAIRNSSGPLKQAVTAGGQPQAVTKEPAVTSSASAAGSKQTAPAKSGVLPKPKQVSVPTPTLSQQRKAPVNGSTSTVTVSKQSTAAEKANEQRMKLETSKKDGSSAVGGIFIDKASVTALTYQAGKCYGQDFVVPVSGYFCKLCHKFYSSEMVATVTHCQSEQHFEKYKDAMLKKIKAQTALSAVASLSDSSTKVEQPPVATIASTSDVVVDQEGSHNALSASSSGGGSEEWKVSHVVSLDGKATKRADSMAKCVGGGSVGGPRGGTEDDVIDISEQEEPDISLADPCTPPPQHVAFSSVVSSKEAIEENSDDVKLDTQVVQDDTSISEPMQQTEETDILSVGRGLVHAKGDSDALSAAVKCTPPPQQARFQRGVNGRKPPAASEATAVGTLSPSVVSKASNDSLPSTPTSVTADSSFLQKSAQTESNADLSSSYLDPASEGDLEKQDVSACESVEESVEDASPVAARGRRGGKARGGVARRGRK